MKNFRFLLAAVAGIVLASCSNDDFIGGSDVAQRNASNGEITFASGMGAITRADIVGADAATLLGTKFIVLGVKGDGTAANMTPVFQNYLVQWQANSAGTSESNTHDWEYAGITAVAPSSIAGTTQTIKYWDYGTASYDFAAFSTGRSEMIASGTPAAGQVLVSAIEYNGADGKGYTLKGSSDDLAKCYIADMVTVEKADYQKTVQMKFRSMGTKVRMAIYETVPGYAIKDVKFYTDNTTPITTGASSTDATLIGADAFKTSGEYTVTYPTIGLSNKGKSDYNKAHVTLGATSTADSNFGFGTLNYVAGEGSALSGSSIYLGRTLNNASYAGTSTYYKTVLPNEEGSSLELRIDYTLVSIDGSNEEIKVHGAKAFVPSTYTKWLPNYAYTYVFKISDNTNGKTSTASGDPEGLFPITFDAVVVDSEEHTQSTITTVTLPSVTTYQKDHVVSSDEYTAAKGDIYVQVSQDGTPMADLNTTGKSKLYTMSTLKSEAEVMDALNIQESATATSVTGRNGLTLTKATIANDITTIVGPDGNDIAVTAGTAAKFTPAAGNYAYVYMVEDKDDTNIFTAVSFDSDSGPSDWASGLYFEDPTGTTPASTFVRNKTYYKKYVDLNTVYSVKVIKVQ
ncbi:MAG: hypothetical protein IJJ90_05965 [Prevotella sp.]|nr:hypothetical protein [Prevotella sp.]